MLLITMFLLKIIFLSFSLIGAIAKPETALNYTANCQITQYSQVQSVLNSCTNIVISNLRVPSNKQLILNLKHGTTLTFRGTTSFEGGTLNDWLMTISGESITVKGEKGSLINAHGELYWDGQGGGGGKIKPNFLQIKNVQNAKFQNINLKNCPTWCTSIVKATDLTMDGWNIDNSAGDKLGRNTDGIGIAWSKNVRISNAFIHNQDQCLYVNQGSNMVFTGIHCVNSNGICATAGFSDTSYEENTTKNITFHNCLMEGGLTGVQVIAMAKPGGGAGELTDITFQNIEMKGVRQQGLFVQMDFGDRGHPNNNLAINHLTMSRIYGTVERGARAVYIICGKKCKSDWVFSNIDIKGSTVPNSCNFEPKGFKC